MGYVSSQLGQRASQLGRRASQLGQLWSYSSIARAISLRSRDDLATISLQFASRLLPISHELARSMRRVQVCFTLLHFASTIAAQHLARSCAMRARRVSQIASGWSNSPICATNHARRLPGKYTVAEMCHQKTSGCRRCVHGSSGASFKNASARDGCTSCVRIINAVATHGPVARGLRRVTPCRRMPRLTCISMNLCRGSLSPKS